MTGSDRTLYRRLLQEARPFWPHIGGMLLLSLLATPLALLAPMPMMIVVDSVIGSHPLPDFLAPLIPTGLRSSNALLAFMAALLVAIALVGELKELAGALLRTYTGEQLMLSFRVRLFAHVQRLSLSYHDSSGTADSTYRIQYDAQSIQYLIIDGIVPFITSTLTVVLMIYVTMRLDAQLALVAVGISPVVFGLLRVYRGRVRGRWREAKALDSSAQSLVQEVLSGIRVVKAFGQEGREKDRFALRSREGMRARLWLALLENSFGLLVSVTLAGGTAAVLWIGAHHVLAGTLTLGGLLMVVVYLSQLYEPLKTVSKRAASLQSHLASAERAFSVLARAPDVIERPHARRLMRATGAITFQDTCFAYEGGPTVLHDVSLEVAPGTRVAITGTTGAGKSTLVSLLPRFYDPTAGRILLDGVDLRDYRLADLRDQFTIVLQDPVLFSTTIAENITYGRPGATADEVIAAAKAAGAHEFIVGLPNDYESQVGERGMQLSGGERQRIALARAFLKNAPVLILDEPTSSVDVRTEAVVLEALERLIRDRTTFLISHRPSPLAACHVRLHLEHGRVAEPAAFAAPQAGRVHPRDRAAAAVHRSKVP
jgi:ATP-binding cassette, subfamily B, bacterial